GAARPSGVARPAPAARSVAIAPVLGRLSFKSAQDPAKVRVSYRYGFSDDLGGGPYLREPSFTVIAGESLLTVGVVDHPERLATPPFPTLQAALDHWNGEGSAVVEILDSRTYTEGARVPAMAAG